ncbi:hypothetical protein PpBr36_07159 [Pyricularia pennisetigena]|uniref:hypothetical protein n=1 Tax=Pyricularia pennisetigena TaxID=1578925 RepID=UPI00114ED598|nr:hypothetical protein PpBr36_07159 [Pyricularia pennisetigena]TLS25465.1 hypothetical protein PpBr36_07159 [Pyricularia pennisetigena]
MLFAVFSCNNFTFLSCYGLRKVLLNLPRHHVLLVSCFLTRHKNSELISELRRPRFYFRAAWRAHFGQDFSVVFVLLLSLPLGKQKLVRENCLPRIVGYWTQVSHAHSLLRGPHLNLGSCLNALMLCVSWFLGYKRKRKSYRPGAPPRGAPEIYTGNVPRSGTGDQRSGSPVLELQATLH